MRDAQGERWLTLREAVEETGMSESAVKSWIRSGLRVQMVRGRNWIAETELFERLRTSLANPRVKTRWANKQRD